MGDSENFRMLQTARAARFEMDQGDLNLS